MRFGRSGKKRKENEARDEPGLWEILWNVLVTIEAANSLRLVVIWPLVGVVDLGACVERETGDFGVWGQRQATMLMMVMVKGDGRDEDVDLDGGW